MNIAFEALRKVVPEFPSIDDEDKQNSKLTKITTLRLAVNYIAALTQILKQSEADEIANTDSNNFKSAQTDVNDNKLEIDNLSITQTAMSLLAGLPFDDSLLLHRPSSCGSSDLPSCSSPSTTETESLQSLESLKSSCWPDFSADDSLDVPDAFDLILESDGESMQFSDDLIT
jgi:bHLH factor